MSAYMLLQTSRMRLPQTHPCQRKPWIEVPVLWYCGRRRSGWPRAPVLAIGLRSSGIKKECPEIDGRASCRLGILVLPAGWLDAPSLPVRQRACVAAVSQCPPVSGLPGARLGGNESGQLQLQGTLRSPPPCMRRLQ